MTAIHNTLTGMTTIRQLPTIAGQPHPLPEHYVLLQVIDTPAPEYDATIQVATSQYQVDLEALTYTKVWTVRDKTEAELTEEINQEALADANNVDAILVNKLLRKQIEQLPDDEVDEFAPLFPKWMVGEPVVNAADSDTGIADRRRWKGVLYKCIISHTTQLDWKPDIATTLWNRTPEPGEIPEWSSFASHEFQNMEIGTAVMDEGTVYYLIDPGQGHWKPSSNEGHFGWSTTNPL